MTKWSYMLCIILISFACVATYGLLSAHRRTGLKTNVLVEALYHDFGTVQTNLAVKHTFTFRNTTTRAILPSSVFASCNCVSAFVEHKLIQPGESVEATVVLRTRQVASEMNQTLKVCFDDPELSPVELKVHASVRPKLFVSTEKITIGYRAGEAASSASFRVSNFGSRQWDSVLFAVNADWVTVDSNVVSPSYNSPEPVLQNWDCSLNLNLTNMSAGIHHAKLIVSTEPKSFSVTIPIELNLIPEIVAFPGTWYSFESEDTVRENTSKIVVRGDMSGALSSLKCVASESLEKILSLELRKIEDSERADHIFLLTGKWVTMPEAEIKGNIEVFCGSDSTESSIVIPVLYVPKNKGR